MAVKSVPKVWRTVNYRNQKFSYSIQGSGTAIVLVPPPGMGATVFDKFDSLADRATVIVPDFLGWEITVLNPGESMIQLYSTLVKTILATEKIDQAVMYGYSAGTTIVQAFSLQHRNRVKAIILAGSYPKVGTTGLDLQYKTGLFFLKIKPGAVIRFLGSAHARKKKFKRKLEQKMGQIHVKGVYRFFEESYYFDCTRFLAGFHLPCLTIYGSNETWISKHRIYYDTMPNHQSATIEHALHQYPVRKPDVVIQIVQSFLRKI